ncbi:MAG: FMN-dependent NADH-azoreductase [Hyphomicrobiales bacterium]|nr:FMN-dependent NADH-azoreductase [Hyphomicrobiales bacterium]
MSTALIITSSALGEASVSNQLIQNTIERLRQVDPELKIVKRDIGANPVPHLTQDTVAAVIGEPQTDAQKRARAFSDELIEEVKAADTIIIGAPMYNFGIASTLKAWFDHVIRAGVTFRYTEAGPEGLLKNKRAIVTLTRGGLYSEGPASMMDSQKPHLGTMLGHIGVDDVTYILAEKLAIGAEARAESIAAAQTVLNDAARHIEGASA